MCSVFWLFWLSYQYLPSDWLRRLLWGSLIVASGSSPESPGWRVRMIFLFYCIASFFICIVLSPPRTWYNYFPTFMARYSLFVLKVPLNLKQTNKPTFFGGVRCVVIWITMWTEEVLNEIFTVEGRGNIANFVDNWRSCGRVLTKFLEGWNVPTTKKNIKFWFSLDLVRIQEFLNRIFTSAG